MAAFTYLALFDWPDVPKAFLTLEQSEAVFTLRRALIEALTSRKGRPALTREELQARLDPASRADERYVKRMRRRSRELQSKENAPMNALPLRVLAIMRPLSFAEWQAFRAFHTSSTTT